jgi:dipeptidyl-peptidase-3
MGMKGTYEATVYFKDLEATKRTQVVINNVQWFEDNSPIDPKFKKKKCKGVQGKVVTVVNLGGSVYPAPPIGINLPNSGWIRSKYGSKSVTLGNLSHAYDQASLGTGAMAEFAYSKEEIDLAKKYGALAGDIHTDLHECIGHASGKLNEGVSGESLKNYHSVIEESRADLVALYYVMDPKMVELKLFPSLDVAKAEYNGYIRGAMLTQLVRIQPGKNIEQAHMRCRALIGNWAYEKGMKEKVIEKKTKDGKTYFVINNYDKLRKIFGEMLIEIQRITSEGDFNSANKLVEKYAVKVDPVLHKEVLARWKKLNIAPYAAFINPVLEPVMKDGKMVDVKVSYPLDFVKQNLEYSKTFGLLPVKN